MTHRARVRLTSRLIALRLIALRLVALCAAALALLGWAVPAARASVSSATATGWLRLANLSPGAPTYDIYLYPVGNMDATLVLRNVGYGMVSSYQSVPAGGYTVALRMAGKPASSPAAVSSTITVTAGQAYTMASTGPSAAPRLELLRDTLTTPKGKSMVRVVQASAGQSRVTVTAGEHTLVRNLAFGDATSFATVHPGTWNLRVTGPSMTATDTDTWTAGTTYTVVVLDSAGHLQIDCLTDGSGAKVQPAGGAQMGFGGTAPRPASSPVPWLTGMAGGGLLAAGGALWLRRTRVAA